MQKRKGNVQRTPKPTSNRDLKKKKINKAL